MRVTDEQFDELLRIVDRHAGRQHGKDGHVARALREVLDRHEKMIGGGK